MDLCDGSKIPEDPECLIKLKPQKKRDIYIYIQGI